MKIWCVEWSGLSHNIYNELFFTKSEAQAAYDRRCHPDCYCKMYQVEDIWRWCARNFQEVLTEIIGTDCSVHEVEVKSESSEVESVAECQIVDVFSRHIFHHVHRTERTEPIVRTAP